MSRTPVALVLLVPLVLLHPTPSAAQEVEARLERSVIGVGETTMLRVVVRGAATARDPEFELPGGLDLLGSSRQQSFAWVNGRASLEHEFRYQIAARDPGRYRIGPMQVRVGSRLFRSGRLELEVVADGPAGRADEDPPARLEADVEPQSPYVGQRVTLRVRLVQLVGFAEDPQYTPPTTTGFWAERTGPPESYYADVEGRRPLVTETRTQLYPLAVGETTIGEAAASVILAEPARDPLGWLGGSRDPRQRIVRSRPITVRVRPLPPDAPEGFGGAVGRFQVAWSADRARTARDVPVTVRLDVRGEGNLPLVRPPRLVAPDAEVFASAVEDSQSAVGTWSRKRFQWTLLLPREGVVSIAPPPFSWFDPLEAAYQRATPEPIRVEVGPAMFATGAAGDGFPPELAEPIDPAGRPARPWGWAGAGLTAGAALALWRRGAGAGRGPGARARALGLVERLRDGGGDVFWKAAEEAAEEIEGWTGKEVLAEARWRELRDRITAARFGGSAGGADRVREALTARLRSVPARGRPRLRYLLVAVLVAAALGIGAASAPVPGDGSAARANLEADRLARQGNIERASRLWLAAWREGWGHPGLAARLAWAHVQEADVGPAAMWCLRGALAESRDPSLGWVTERVREAGGLLGATPARLPVRRLEWGLTALALGLGAGFSWPRRVVAAGLAVLCLAAGAAFPLQGWLAKRAGQAVVLRQTGLEGTDIELEAGQVVTLRERAAERVRVSAGRRVEGWLPSSVVGRLLPAGDSDG